MKKAFITGITGQDGSYLAEFLLSKGYEVWGMVRRCSSPIRSRIDHLRGKLHLVYGDVTDGCGVASLIYDIKPDEVYNLAAQSHVRVSFEQPCYTLNVGALGTLHLLEAIHVLKIPVRFYQASSSEMFGNAEQEPQSEITPFHPCSPYACAKLYAHYQTINYREAYGIFACNGILFNHEGPRRSESFVTRKITQSVARIKYGLQNELSLGNLEAKRDWGFSGDYVEAMWRMLQQEKADDYVIATGESHSVREFLEEAFGYVDMDWREHVKVDPYYFRPSELHVLRGDMSKAKRVMQWEPKVTFKELVRMMVDADMELVSKEKEK
jgi:GDPmannose 4,6-dehydratase